MYVCVWTVSIWGGYSPTSDLDLGKKVGNLDFGGGYSPTSDLDLGKKVGNLDFWIWGGVFCVNFLGGYSETQVKVPRSLTIFGGGWGGGYSEAQFWIWILNVWVTTYIYYYFLLFLTLLLIYFIKEKSN